MFSWLVFSAHHSAQRLKPTNQMSLPSLFEHSHLQKLKKRNHVDVNNAETMENGYLKVNRRKCHSLNEKDTLIFHEKVSCDTFIEMNEKNKHCMHIERMCTCCHNTNCWILTVF